jgi:hypothetical protein
MTTRLSGLTTTASLPAPALIREISVSGRQVVISPSSRRISAIALASLGRIAASSIASLVKAASRMCVPIAFSSRTTRCGVTGAGAGPAAGGAAALAVGRATGGRAAGGMAGGGVPAGTTEPPRSGFVEGGPSHARAARARARAASGVESRVSAFIGRPGRGKGLMPRGRGPS